MYCARFRWYEPTLGRWLERDPLGYVDGLSGYCYVSNNPGIYSDPTGQFKGEYHRSITAKALANSGLSIACVERIVRANVGQDDGAVTNTGPFADPLNHGDGGRIKETIERMRQRRDQVVSSDCNGDADCASAIAALDQVGHIFHALQDLYAHSDYVEVEDKRFGGAELGQIPIWKFIDDDGVAHVPPGIISGSYEWPFDRARPPSHAYMNKDSPRSYRGKSKNGKGITMFDLARDLATRATEAYWSDIWAAMTPEAQANLRACCAKAQKASEAASLETGEP